MSFVELLQKARDKHHIKPEKTFVENLVDIPIEQEVQTETKQETSAISIGDAIIKISAQSLKSYKKSKLKGNPTGKSRRIAKAIAANNVRLSQLNKAFDIQKQYNPRRADWHVVGGYALQALRNKLEQGMPLHEALNSQFERNIDE
jgi:hypothetical protein